MGQELNPMERMAGLTQLLDQRLAEVKTERDEWINRAMRRAAKIYTLKAELIATEKVANDLRAKLKSMTEDKDTWRREAMAFRKKLAEKEGK